MKRFNILLIVFFLSTIMIIFKSKTSATVKKRVLDINYVTHIKQIPGKFRHLKIWIPIPQDNEYQSIRNLSVKCPYDYVFTKDKKYGNKMLYIIIDRPSGNFDVEINFSSERKECNAKIGYSKKKDALSWGLIKNKFVPISIEARNKALSIIRNTSESLEKASLIYENTIQHMEYDKSGKGWGNGDYQYACDVGKGNCTDFHAYFITLMRNISVPSYFEIGVSVPQGKTEGLIKGYHCWAYFWDDKSWKPVDISEADKRPEKKEYFFGSIDENRIAFTAGRDIMLEPKQKAPPLNYFIYPYAEVDGVKHSGVIRNISFKDETY